MVQQFNNCSGMSAIIRQPGPDFVEHREPCLYGGLERSATSNLTFPHYPCPVLTQFTENDSWSFGGIDH